MKKIIYGLALCGSCLLTLGEVAFKNYENIKIQENTKDEIIENAFDNDLCNKTLPVSKLKARTTSSNEGGYDTSKMFAQAGKDATGVSYMRYLVAVRGSFNKMEFVRDAVGGKEENIIQVTTVYQSITSNGKKLYYNPETKDLTEDETFKGEYYFACYSIKYVSSTLKSTDITLRLKITTNEDTIEEACQRTFALSTLLSNDQSKLIQDLGESVENYNIKFGLSENTAEEYTSNADDIYAKFSTTEDKLKFDFIGFGEFSDVEYVKVVLKDHIFDQGAQNVWSLGWNDSTIHISNKRAYLISNVNDFWATTNWANVDPNNGYDETIIELSTPTFTQHEGYFTLGLEVAKDKIDSYSDKSQLKAIFTEWNAGNVIDNHDYLYGGVNPSKYMLYNGNPTGDIAKEEGYVTLQERTIAKNEVALHDKLVNDSTIRNNKLTLKVDGKAGYTDIFATRDENGVYIRGEQFVSYQMFTDVKGGNYAKNWWHSDNLECHIGSGSYGENDYAGTGSSKKIVLCTNTSLLEQYETDWTSLYVSDAHYDATTQLWNINYEGYLAYSKIRAYNIDTQIFCDFGVNNLDGWTCTDTYNEGSLFGMYRGITTNGFVNIRGDRRGNGQDTYYFRNWGDWDNSKGWNANVSTGWDSNKFQVRFDGKYDFEFEWNFKNYTNGTTNNASYIQEIYSNVHGYLDGEFKDNWTKGGATLRPDWCWHDNNHAWIGTTSTTWNSEINTKYTEGEKETPVLNFLNDSTVRSIVKYNATTSDIIVTAYVTHNNTSDIIINTYTMNTKGYNGAIVCTLGCNWSSVTNVVCKLHYGQLMMKNTIND